MGENNTKDENKKKQSILENTKEADVFYLTKDEYLKLNLFFLTYPLVYSIDKKDGPMCRTYTDYGWENNRFDQTGLGSKIKEILDLSDNDNFKFIDTYDISQTYSNSNLTASKIRYDYEQGVLKTLDGDVKENKENIYDRYKCLFRHIRNCLAHGRYILRININGEKIFIFEDKKLNFNKKSSKKIYSNDTANNNDENNRYTARIVIKHDTIFKIISVIDKNNVLEKMENGVINNEAPTNIIPLEREQQMYGT